MGCGFESVLERVGKCGQSTLGAGSAVVKLVPSLSVTAAIVQLGSKAMGGLIPSMSLSYAAPALYPKRGGSLLGACAVLSIYLFVFVQLTSLV